MATLIPPQTVLTPGDAANQLQSRNLDALGLSVPALSTVWSGTTPAGGSYDATTLRLTLNNPLAPFKAPLSLLSQAPQYSDVAGMPITGPVGVLRLLPEAARRLSRLMDSRLGLPQIRPVPVAMVIHGITMPATPQPINWFAAGESMGLTGSFAVSFHCERGLPICPIAVASIFDDLIQWQPAISFGNMALPARTAAGGLAGIVALDTANTIRVHVIDPHGRAYTPTRAEAQLKVVDGSGAAVSTIPASGLTTLSPGQGLGRATSDNAADTAANNPLHWGWSYQSTLARTRINPPAPPATVNLPVQFFRVTAVDLPWHLIGNRTDGVLDNVPADDGAVPDFALPVVRPSVPNFDYLSDANDVLGACGQMAQNFPPSGLGSMALLCSPVIDPALPLPPTITPPPAPPAPMFVPPPAVYATNHWPAFPGPNPGLALPPMADATNGMTAAFRNPADATNARLDVVVTIVADAVPAGTHIRIYPRRFVTIRAIENDQPSFVRDDGGAAIAVAGQPTLIMLSNPFVLAPAAPLPNPAKLLVDVVVVGRDGKRRMHSGQEITISAITQTFTPNLAQFGGTALLQQPALNAIMSVFGSTSIAPASLFGIPPSTLPSTAAPSGFLDFVRRLANETTAPRQGPRLPTQGRFETIFALGRGPAGQPHDWRAVVTGARWTTESRSFRPDMANPGNPAGPDVHAAGVRVDGQLAYDVALHALKRAQPIIPLSATTPGWMIATGGDNWDDPPADTTGTVAGVMLETIAAFCDSPELGLSVIPVPGPGDTIQNAINTLSNLIGINPPMLNVAKEPRLKRQLQREMVTARSGQRDALWSLIRAIHHAREFIYIESPSFAYTARPEAGSTPAKHEIDLVELIRARMAANARLKVMICTPKWPDFDLSKENWVRAALKQRKEAIERLTNQDRQRVAAFHPIGFPGRSAVMRSTTVIVDDVYSLVGTSHWRRRGMTFDGACDIASIDRQLNARGTSQSIVQFRQELMANKLGINQPTGPGDTTAAWTRLADPEAAFDQLSDLLAQGGLGRCSPIWAGPPASDNSVIPKPDKEVDPDGVDANGSRILSDLLGLLGDS